MDPIAHLPRWFCCAAITVASAPPLGAQEPRTLVAPPEFAIDQWTTEHGLPQNSVNAVVQGPDGYLWVGTFGGLARFDGNRFTLMERTDGDGRHVDRVLRLAMGEDGALWIGTENGLLRRKDGAYQVFTTREGLPDDEIRSLHVDDAGVVWIGTTTGGLTWLTEGKFRTVRDVQGTPLGQVVSILAGGNGTIWANTSADRVVELPEGDVGKRRWRLPAAERRAHVLLHDRAGADWLGTATGASRVASGAVHPYTVPGSSMVEDEGGGYWVGTINDGLYYFRIQGDAARGDSAVVHRYPLPDGRLAFRVRSTYRDADGSVWVGTNANGLLRARRNLFTTYTGEHGLSHDVATAIFGDGTGTVWVGTNCGGVNAIDPARRTVRVFNPRSSGDPDGDPCVFALAADTSGTILQGSYGRGVSTLWRPGGGPRQSVSGLADSVVLALLTARDGTLWVGTRTGGLIALDGRTVRATYTTADGLAHNSIRTIQETRDGALWIGTLEGLSRFHEGRFTSYTAADGLSSAHVRAIHEDVDGGLWIGTYGGGLNRFEGGVFTAITRRDGLADDVVSSILEDDAGRFWMSGNRGIYRTARSQLVAFAEGRLDRVHSVLYGRADGLRNPETNGGFQPAAWKDPGGHLWFPTLDGVAVVDPSRAETTGHAPSVALEEVIVDGVSRPPEAALVVGPGRPNLEFRYAGLSLSAPEHVSFRYRLEGFDADWVEAGVRRVAYYPHLPAGTYRFVVRAANRDGLWSETGAAMQLRVVPAFWSLWWVRLGAAATLLALLVGVLRRRESGARRAGEAKDEFSRRLIESQEHERMRLAGELHDGLGQDLLIVRNRALLALRADGVEARVRVQLGHISDVVTSSLESIRELAHNLTPHQLGHLGLSSALEAMAEAVAETSGIDLDIRIEKIDGLLPVESQINLYRIVQEALNNMVRHSGAPSAALHVRADRGRVRVTIADRGRGFHQRDGAQPGAAGFGLSGMAERARILEGSLEVRTTPGHGTRIELSVPVMVEAGT